jgi:hypothetical protein
MKKIIAKEWLLFVSFLIASVILNILSIYYYSITYYNETYPNYISNRQRFYEFINGELKLRAKKNLENNYYISEDSILSKENIKPNQISNNRKNSIVKINDFEEILNYIKKDNSKPFSKLQQWAARYPYFNDTNKPIGTFEQFYKILEIQRNRDEFMYYVLSNNGVSVLERHDILFDHLLSRPPQEPSLLKSSSWLYYNLFHGYERFKNWISLLMLYFIFLFARTMIYSIRIIKNKSSN